MRDPEATMLVSIISYIVIHDDWIMTGGCSLQETSSNLILRNRSTRLGGLRRLGRIFIGEQRSMGVAAVANGRGGNGSWLRWLKDLGSAEAHLFHQSTKRAPIWQRGRNHKGQADAGSESLRSSTAT